MNTTIEHRNNPDSGRAKPPLAPADTLSSLRLNPKRLGLGFGTTGVVFYFGCMITMATAPRDKAVVFFNSLLHGFDVEPVLQTRVPAGEVVVGLISTFILGWFAGALIAVFYNWGLRTPGKEA